MLAAVATMAAYAGCGGSGEEASGAKSLNWYVFNEPGGAFEKAIDNCNKQANGRYKINYVRLPTDANQQRELIARRLAAEDTSIDLVGMDVIWTAEFAEAGWVLPWDGARRDEAVKGKLEGPLKTVQYQGKVWGAPFTSNTQLLWYRKDRVPKPADDVTWEQLIDQASKQGKGIEVQGNQYEGLTAWVNALVNGAGSQLVNQQGKVTATNASIEAAAKIVHGLATSKAAPPGLATAKEDEARLGFQEGRSNYQTNYTFIYPSASEVKGFQEKIGWARYPRTVPDRPSRPPLGGINLGVGAFSTKKDLAFDAALCLAQPQNQAVASELGGLPPTSNSAYELKQVTKAFPFADLLRESIEQAGPRPVTPAYSDVSLAVQKSFHPEEKIDPAQVPKKLRDRLEKAGEGKIF